MGQMGHGSPMLTHGPLWYIENYLYVSYMTSSESSSSFKGHVLREPGDMTPRSDSQDSDNICISLPPVPPLGTISPICSPLSEPTTSQTAVSPTSPGISQAFFSLGLSLATSQVLDSPLIAKRMGRPRKLFYGNIHSL